MKYQQMEILLQTHCHVQTVWQEVTRLNTKTKIRLFADVIRETSEASQSTEDINVELPAKRLRYINCQSDEHQKFLKREYIR